MFKNKPKVKPLILLASDSPDMGTGFGDMGARLMRALGKKYDRHQIGWQKFGMPITFNGWKLHPGGPNRYLHNYGSISIPDFLDRYQTDLMITFQDIHCLDYMPDIKNRPTWLAYFPIDTHDFKDEWVDIAAHAEYPTTYSHFGQRVLDKMGLDAHMIYHGIETDVFKPMNTDISRNNVKRMWEVIDDKGNKSSLEGKFVVGFVGRFNRRKMLHRWLAIFKKFAEGKDDVIGFWQTDPDDPMGDNQFQLREALEMLQIQDKFVHNLDMKWWKPQPPKMLNLVYNLMDVHLYPTGGEGFGLTIAESMSAGIPNCVTNYTTGPEFLTGPKGRMRGELLPIKEWVTLRKAKRPWVDIDKSVEILNRLYEDEQLRKTYSCRSRQWAKTIDWDKKIKYKFMKLVKEAVGY